MAMSFAGRTTSSLGNQATGFDIFDASGVLNAFLVWDNTERTERLDLDARVSLASVSLGGTLTMRNGVVLDRYGYTAKTAAGAHINEFDMTGASNLGHLGADAAGSTPAAIVAIPGRSAIALSSPNHVQLMDVSTPSAPSSLSLFFDSTNLSGAKGLDTDGDYLYVAGTDRLTVVNITTMTAPSVAGAAVFSAPSLGTTFGVLKHPAREEVWVISQGSTAGQWGLSCVDVTNKAAPTITLNRSTTGITTDYPAGVHAQLAVIGDYLFMGDPNGNTLRKFDITTSSAPSLVDSLTDATYLANCHIVRSFGSRLFAVGANHINEIGPDISAVTTRPRLRGGQTIVGELRGGQRWN